MSDPEAQLDAFIGKFSPDNQILIRQVRAALRQLLPTAHELVYDNYNFFVIGYCATQRPSDCILSIAAAANGVSLSFYRGADLVDSRGILQGAGTQNRFVRIGSAAMLDQPDIKALIEQAVQINKTALPAAGGGTTVIRSVSDKQRPRV